MAGVQAVEAHTRHAFPRHTHEQYGIGVICLGAQRWLSGRGVVEASRGDVITVNPGEVHDGAPIGDGGRWWRMLYFDPPVIAAALSGIDASRSATFEFFAPVIANREMARDLQQVFSVLTRSGVDAANPAEELLLMLLARLVHERKDIDTQVPPASIRNARALIDDDPTSPITLADLARVSGLSRFQVLRGFVSAIGLTPHAYLVQRRMDIARGLIGCGVPLGEAAAAGGFADQSHMTRIFVRKYGVTPRVYADAVSDG
jgi:AraC-like DNA-binding protein